VNIRFFGLPINLTFSHGFPSILSIGKNEIRRFCSRLVATFS